MLMQPGEADRLLYCLSARTDASERDFGRPSVERLLQGSPADAMSHPFWRYFHPLLRQGDVEEVAKRRYRVCAPVLRWFNAAGAAAWFGARVPEAWDAIRQVSRGRASIRRSPPNYPARWLVKADHTSCADMARELGIGFSDNPVTPFWEKLPSFHEVLKAIPNGGPPPRKLKNELANGAKLPGVFRMGGEGREPISHWLILRPDDPPRELPANDEIIHIARWYTACAAGRLMPRYDESGAALNIPYLRMFPLPSVVERLLTMESGGVWFESEMLSFAPLTSLSAREALRVLRIRL